MAGIEAALALRAFAGSRAAVTVVDPGRRFAIPASAAGSAFGIAPPVDVAMSRVVGRAGAALRRSHLVCVDPQRRLVMLAGGELLRFDHLIVAVGPRQTPQIPEALTFRGHADVPELRAMVEGMVRHAERGGDTDLVIAIPRDCGWPLAGYEIALMTREHVLASGLGEACHVTVVTAEDVPLGAFGPTAGETVVGKLRKTGIEIVTGTSVKRFRWGRLEMGDGSSRGADRVVALPVARGPSLCGLPKDAAGFVLCEPDGTVPDAPGVRVVGDAGAFPVKRGGVACQQADSAAAAIARDVGADTEELPFMPAMPEWVWDGADGWLSQDGERVFPGDQDPSRWWPVPKTTGRFLAPFLHEIARAPTPAAPTEADLLPS
jgi:sulfide:quinone oxidoreductase